MSDSIDLAGALSLRCDDAAGRAEIWGEMTREYLRLGTLAMTLSGDRKLPQLSAQAANVCLRQMEAEQSSLAITIRGLEALNVNF